jgi:hypothetical protein
MRRTGKGAANTSTAGAMADYTFRNIALPCPTQCHCFTQTLGRIITIDIDQLLSNNLEGSTVA